MRANIFCPPEEIALSIRVFPYSTFTMSTPWRYKWWVSLSWEFSRNPTSCLFNVVSPDAVPGFFWSVNQVWRNTSLDREKLLARFCLCVLSLKGQCRLSDSITQEIKLRSDTGYRPAANGPLVPDSHNLGDRTFAAVVREAKAALQITSSFSFRRPTPVHRQSNQRPRYLSKNLAMSVNASLVSGAPELKPY